MDKGELERRTKAFALRVMAFVARFPRTPVNDSIGRQLVDAGTSIGANYREANRAESRRDFIHKIGVVEKEASETQYWLELCQTGRIGDGKVCGELLAEATELLAIFTSIGRSTKGVRSNSKFAIRNSAPPLGSLIFLLIWVV